MKGDQGLQRVPGQDERKRGNTDEGGRRGVNKRGKGQREERETDIAMSHERAGKGEGEKRRRGGRGNE